MDIFLFQVPICRVVPFHLFVHVKNICRLKEKHMRYLYHQHEVRKYLRRHRETMAEEIVSVTNINRLSVKEHMGLLNLNSPDYEYLAFLGTVDITK